MNNDMMYQLVIQFSDDLVDYDGVVNLEDDLMECLTTTAEVDGHDIGSNEVNIFILTETPESTLKAIKCILDDKLSIDSYKVAYRSCTGEKYTILYPPNLEKFSIV